MFVFIFVFSVVVVVLGMLTILFLNNKNTTKKDINDMTGTLPSEMFTMTNLLNVNLGTCNVYIYICIYTRIYIFTCSREVRRSRESFCKILSVLIFVLVVIVV